MASMHESFSIQKVSTKGLLTLKYISESDGENLQANDHVVISLHKTKTQKLSAPHPSENKDWFTVNAI